MRRWKYKYLARSHSTKPAAGKVSALRGRLRGGKLLVHQGGNRSAFKAPSPRPSSARRAGFCYSLKASAANPNGDVADLRSRILRVESSWSCDACRCMTDDDAALGDAEARRKVSLRVGEVPPG